MEATALPQNEETHLIVADGSLVMQESIPNSQERGEQSGLLGKSDFWIQESSFSDFFLTSFFV